VKKTWGMVGILCLGIIVCQKEPATGSIDVSSVPTGADVYLDDSLTGMKTNCVLQDVPFGRHMLKLALEGYAIWERNVEVSEDNTQLEVNAGLSDAMGAINITSEPAGAWVWLNGDSTGHQTNCLITDLYAGNYIIHLELEGYYDWQDTVTLEDEDTLTVNAVLVEENLDQVTGLVAQATTDGLGIRLTWDAVTNAESYSVYFNGVLMLDEITVTEYTHADPGETGSYTVSASAGTTEGQESVPLSTEASAIQELTVGEINSQINAGIGWDVNTGSASSYHMADDTHKDVVDCYFTDFEASFSGSYVLASADVAESDPGIVWSIGTGWRASALTDHLGMSIEDVTQVTDQGWYNYSDDLVQGETYAVWIHEGYYALVGIVSINKGNGEVQIKTRFQPIQGFRLF